MDFHAFMYVTIGRRHELERGMAGKDPVLMAMFLGQHGPRLRINQFGYVLPTHNPLRVAEHAATLDHLLGGRLNVAFVRGYQARWFENYAAVAGARAAGPWNRRSDEDARKDRKSTRLNSSHLVISYA